MNWQQLEYFKILAEEQNFTKAALKLSITQPALSKSIAKLEEEIRAPLFEKSGRGVRLTRYGALFLEHVSAATAEIEAGIRELHNMINPDVGTVAIAAVHSAGSNLIPGLIASFMQIRPNVRFRFAQESTAEIFSQLTSRQIDLGFFNEFDADYIPQEIQSVVVKRDEFVLIVSKTHYLAERESVSLQELKEEKFVVVCEGIKRAFCLLSEQLGFSPKISIAPSESSLVSGFVAANAGIAVVPYSPDFDRTRLAVIRIEEPAYERTLRMGWVAGRGSSPIAEIFRQHVLEALALPDGSEAVFLERNPLFQRAGLELEPG